MGEFVHKGEAEIAIAKDPNAYEAAEEAAVGVHSKQTEEELKGFVGEEDFTDPSHPLYGQVDEHGRALPGWLEQITFRQYAPLPQL